MNSLFPKFGLLHGHSDFSDGFDKVSNNVRVAQEKGLDALAITDHGTCAGLATHWKACRDANIKPILGSEFYLRLPESLNEPSRNSGSGRYHITLLTTNFNGYERLLAANNDAHSNMEIARNGKFPIATFDMFKEHFTDDGSIIFLTGCVASVTFHDEITIAEEYVNTLIKLVGKNNVYAELQPHEINMQRGGNDFLLNSYSRPLELANKLGIKTVWSNDFHAAQDDHLPLLEMYTKTMKGYSFTADAIRSQEDVYGEAVKKIGKDEADKAFAGITEIIERVEDVDLHNEPTLPPAHEAVEALKRVLPKLLEKDIKESGVSEQVLRDRFQTEWSVWDDYNLWPYFAVLYDIVKHGQDKKVLMIARGSASGSLLLYLMGCSQLHPIIFNLPFERFLARPRLDAGDYPDVDIDIAASKRYIIQDYAKERWGFQPVGTILTYAHSSLVRLIERVYRSSFNNNVSVPKEIVDNASDCDDTDPFNEEAFVTFLNYVQCNSEKEKLELIEQNRLGHNTRQLKANLPVQWATKMYNGLLGARSGYGRHACAVVPQIEGIPVPIESFASEAVVAYTESGMNKSLQEICGLIKYDFLSTDTLDILQQLIDMTGVMPPKVAPDGDACFEQFNTLDVTGLFQFDTRTARMLLGHMKDNHNIIKSILTLSDLTSLGRPGPLKQDYHIVYAERSADISNHPDFIQEVYKKTRGVLIYQEQVYELFGRVAYPVYDEHAKGMAIIDGKALVPKTVRMIDDPKFIAKYESLREKFVSGGMKYHNLEENYANELFESLAGFIRYGFNLSHSLSYANLSAQQAWFKWYYPKEYWAVILSKVKNDAQDKPKLLSFLMEASKQSGLVFRTPHVNHASNDYVLVGNEIQCPITMVDGLGPTVAEAIINGQPFTSMKDFNERVPTANRTIKKLLFDSGMLEGLDGDLLDLGVCEQREYTLRGKQWTEENEACKTGKVIKIEEDVLCLDDGTKLRYYKSNMPHSVNSAAKELGISVTSSFKNLWVGHTILYYATETNQLISYARVKYEQPQPDKVPLAVGIRNALGFFIPENLQEVLLDVDKAYDQNIGYVLDTFSRITDNGTSQVKVIMSNGETVWFFIDHVKPNTYNFLRSKTKMSPEFASTIQPGDLLRYQLVYDYDEDGNLMTYKQVRYAKVLC